MLHTRFSGGKLVGLLLLCAGAVATQLGEASSAAILGGKGNVLLGCSLTVLSSVLSAMPNVFYESILKGKDQDQWVANVQLTIWILIWVVVIRSWSPGEGMAMGIAQMTAGFTPAVWLIVFLKTLNCVIIPLILKYGDNILYGYAKPVSIVATCAATSVVTSSLPAPSMVVGIA